MAEHLRDVGEASVSRDALGELAYGAVAGRPFCQLLVVNRLADGDASQLLSPYGCGNAGTPRHESHGNHVGPLPLGLGDNLPPHLHAAHQLRLRQGRALHQVLRATLQ